MKKITALFLVFSLMMLSTNLYAKERRGAKLIITKKDGLLIEGELIAVRNYLLLIIESGEISGFFLDIRDIKVIKIVKESKAGKGLGIGALIGVGGAALFGSLDTELDSKNEAAVAWGIFLVPTCALIGGLIGAAAGIDKKIHFEGMTDQEIQKALDSLRKKARVRDYK